MISRDSQTWPADFTTYIPETTCPHLVIDAGGHCEHCFMWMGQTDEDELAVFEGVIQAEAECEAEYARRTR